MLRTFKCVDNLLRDDETSYKNKIEYERTKNEERREKDRLIRLLGESIAENSSSRTGSYSFFPLNLLF